MRSLLQNRLVRLLPLARPQHLGGVRSLAVVRDLSDFDLLRGLLQGRPFRLRLRPSLDRGLGNLADGAHSALVGRLHHCDLAIAIVGEGNRIRGWDPLR